MRRIIYIILFLIGSLTNAQDNSSFILGNEFYNNGDFQKAITTYESILKTDKHSAELYFNLANAYYKTNQTAPSIYYYEKALQLAPNDRDIKNNLAYAQNMTIDAIDVIPEVGFTKIIKNIINMFSFDTWALIAVILIILFVVLFLNYYFAFTTIRKRLMFLTGFSCLGLALISIAFAYQKFNMVKNDNPAIVFAQETQVKSEPNLRSESAFDLHEGTKVQVLEKYDDNWTKIGLSDGKTGWISSGDIKVLNNF
jgi:tetratricopeptide (TPR) repeat protein